ncbi:MAG: zf-HC2 domain-containing protein, partial [Hyphomicrobiaceae bacterium]|nr:zf-HC2 domain-containing protein [Hyphomicrobiaceae bacterium]
MKCRNAKKLVFDFIDGLDNEKDRLELEQHLAQCPECDKLASQLVRSMDLLHRAPQEKTSENFAWKARLKLNQERNAVRERSVSRSALIRAWNLRYVATAVSAFAVVLTVGLLAVNSEIFVAPTVDGGADPSIEIAETPDAADAGGREGLNVANNQTIVG